MSVAFESRSVAQPAPSPQRRPPPAPSALRVADLLGALSHALDITEGQPEGHCVRCCWIGVRIGEELRLSPLDLRDLYYTLLLKDLGCSSNAARISALYLTDDLSFKRGHKIVGDSFAQVLRFVVSHTGAEAGFVDRVQSLMNIARNGGEIARDLIAVRCERGADIAHRLRFSDAVAEGIRCLDEHWDGQGRPAGLAGNDIPRAARIALLAQVVDVFHTSGGRDAALAEVRHRTGTWFDPAVVAAFDKVAAGPEFWSVLASPRVEERVFALEPGRIARAVDEAYLDDVAAAFGGIVDAKSPYTAGHSSRVADYAEMVAAELDLPSGRRRWLRRAALLHDIGKLGVPNTILDKPGKLTPQEWQVVRRHPALSEAILSRVAAFGPLARVAGAHHERLDGKGYPNGLTADAIPLDARIITVADVFDALTARRPYREPMGEEAAVAVMLRDAGTAFDRRCLAALASAVAKRTMFESL